MALKKKIPLLKHPGKPLPKRLLRPFAYIEPYSLDDKRYVLVAGGDRTAVVHGFMLFPYLIGVGGAGITIVSWLTGKVSQWSDFDLPIPEVSIFALAIALTMHYFVKRMKPTRFNIFDREAGMVHKPYFFSRNGVLSVPWKECEARIMLSASHGGVPQHMLMLVHLPTYYSWMISGSNTGIYHLLGIWSFLVQYMDKGASLPDIPALANYPNRTKGLGSLAEWEESGIAFTQHDPYAQWRAELEAHPELDVMNREIEQHRGW